MSKPKLLLFNGPPRSGKDTSAIRIMNRHDNVHFDRFAMPIKRAFAGTMNAEIDVYGNCEPYESTKGDVIPWFGISYRQWQIDFSEKFLKRYGVNIFGHLFVQRNAHVTNSVIVVPDSGFAEEVAPIVTQFGMDNVHVIRVHRPGFDFSGDSRSYLADGTVEHMYDVHNDTTVLEFNEKIDSLYERIIGGH